MPTLGTLRCEVSGNPSGTDCWVVGFPCKCKPCQTWCAFREHVAELVAERDRLRADLVRLRAELARLSRLLSSHPHAAQIQVDGLRATVKRMRVLRDEIGVALDHNTMHSTTSKTWAEGVYEQLTEALADHPRPGDGGGGVSTRALVQAVSRGTDVGLLFGELVGLSVADKLAVALELYEAGERKVSAALLHAAANEIEGTPPPGGET